MISRCGRVILFFLVFIAFCPTSFAQDGWHRVTMLGLNKVPLTKLRGIAIPAEAEYQGEKIKAYVFFSGYDGHSGGTGHPSFGVYVENIGNFIPESEIDKFRGPDLSQYAMQSDAMRLSVRNGTSTKEIRSRLLFTDGRYFDTGFETDGSFEANPSKSAANAWAQFLAQMSGGFTEGEVVIGGKAFSKPLIVRFSGLGMGTKLKELMAFCSKQ